MTYVLELSLCPICRSKQCGVCGSYKKTPLLLSQLTLCYLADTGGRWHICGSLMSAGLTCQYHFKYTSLKGFTLHWPAKTVLTIHYSKSMGLNFNSREVNNPKDLTTWWMACMARLVLCSVHQTVWYIRWFLYNCSSPYSSCVGCATFWNLLQLDLQARTSRTVQWNTTSLWVSWLCRKGSLNCCHLIDLGGIKTCKKPGKIWTPLQT